MKEKVQHLIYQTYNNIN